MTTPETAQSSASLVTAWMPLMTGGMTLLGVFAGIISTTLIERFKTEAANNRDKENRDEARRDKLRERRNDFQRQTLLDLQDAVLIHMQDLTKIHALDRISLNQHGKRFVDPYPAELDQARKASAALVSKLRVRVLDDEARKLIEGVTAAASNSLFMTDDEFTEMTVNIIFAADRFNKRVGVLLRTLDESL